MKNNNPCCKCGSRDIIRIPGLFVNYGSGNLIPTGSFWSASVKVVRYLCGQCGFSEEWVEGQKDIEKVRKKYVGS